MHSFEIENQFIFKMILPIVAYGHPVLRKECEDIDQDYPELSKLIEDMWETMYYTNGVGLAAPQINRAVRIFVVDTDQIVEGFDEEDEKEFPDEKPIKKTFINAHIVDTSGEPWAYNEGCLSIPKVREDIMRPEHVRLKYVDENFTEHIEEAACITSLKQIPFGESIHQLERVWDIFGRNEQAIKEDFQIVTHDLQSQLLPDYVTALNPSNIFVEPGAKVYPCIINAEAGPVYIGKDAEIMEGCIIRGPFVLGEHAVLKMGAKVYGGTTLGPGCKVGGEISNVVFFANSNKGHDGFLGNAVIGEWCNLGADTNCSNLKNNYDEVKIWDEYENKSVKTGLQFCGLIMGDHSKCGINTMFNTGTVAGVSCNIYGSGFPEKFIPSFSWGGSEGMVTYALDKAIATANRMMMRRHKELSTGEINVLKHIFNSTQKQRELMNVSK